MTYPVVGRHVEIVHNSTYGSNLNHPTHITGNNSAHLPVFGYESTITPQKGAQNEHTPIVPFKVSFLGVSGGWTGTWNNWYFIEQHHDLQSITILNPTELPNGVIVSTNTYTYLAPTSPSNSTLKSYIGVQAHFSGIFSIEPERIHISYRVGLGDVITTQYLEEVEGEVTNYVKDPGIVLTYISLEIKDLVQNTYTANTTVDVRPVYGVPWVGFPIPPN